MQTFITDYDIQKTAEVLDNRRLGKQRVEAIQIARCLLIQETRWKNHPAVKMWRGYEPFLIRVYLKEMINEWIKRGFKNERCEQHYNELITYVNNQKILYPPWITEKFIESHRSNLIRKKPDYYNEFWSVQDNLEYIWPI